MTYNVIFPIASNSPIVSTLLWEIKIVFWETEITFPNVSILCLHLKTVSQRYFLSFVHSEAPTGGVLKGPVLRYFAILYSQENTSVWASFPTQVFSCEYCKIFRNTYFEEHLRMAASVHPMLSKALQPSFHCALVFVQWHFVLVEKYQIKFFITEISHSKSIFSNIPSVLYVTWCVLQRVNFTPRNVLS